MIFKALRSTKDDFIITRWAGARYLEHLLNNWLRKC